MGLEDRDWYWRRRARRNSPDDDYLFPSHQSPGRKSAIFPIALVVLAMLALLVFGLHQGWFDHDGRSHAAKVMAEERALRADEQQRYPNGRPVEVPQARRAHDIPTFEQRQREEARVQAEGERDATIDLLIAICAIPSPLVLVALLIGLFIGPVRRPAMTGLMFGFAGGFAGAIAQKLNLTHQDSAGLGAMIQTAAKVGCFFTLTAITAAVVAFVRSQPSPAPSTATASTPDVAAAGLETQSTAMPDVARAPLEVASSSPLPESSTPGEVGRPPWAMSDRTKDLCLAVAAASGLLLWIAYVHFHGRTGLIIEQAPRVVPGESAKSPLIAQVPKAQVAPGVSAGQPYAANDWRLVPLSVPRPQGPVYLDIRTMRRTGAINHEGRVTSAQYKVVNTQPQPDAFDNLVEHIDYIGQYDCQAGTRRRVRTVMIGPRFASDVSYKLEKSEWWDLSAIEKFEPVKAGTPEADVLRLLCDDTDLEAVLKPGLPN